MIAMPGDQADLSEAWIDQVEGARWRSGAGHGPSAGAQASGSSFLEVDPGCHLPRHTDSAEEVIVVVAGTASVMVGQDEATVSAGGLALVPAHVPHEVRNTGEELLRFVAAYAAAEVVTRYERDVQPDGGRERAPFS